MSLYSAKTRVSLVKRNCGSSVVRHLPLVLEVPGSIPARGEENFGGSIPARGEENFGVQTRFL